MAKTRFLWTTRAEARAFVRGVEHTNDSALEVTAVYRNKDHWVVALEDEDSCENETVDERAQQKRDPHLKTPAGANSARVQGDPT